MQPDARPAPRRARAGAAAASRAAGCSATCPRHQGARRPRAACEQRPPRRPRRGQRAQAVAPGQVERRGRLTAPGQERDPRDAAALQVGAHHAPAASRPSCGSPAARGRARSRAPRVHQPHPQLDVLHHRRAVLRRVEASARMERLAPDRAEPRPERVGRARRRPGARSGGAGCGSWRPRPRPPASRSRSRRRAVSPGSASKARRMRRKASGCTATSASTNTRMSPDAGSAPALRACGRPRVAGHVDHDDLLGPVVRRVSIAPRQAASVSGRSVAGTIAVRHSGVQDARDTTADCRPSRARVTAHEVAAAGAHARAATSTASTLAGGGRLAARWSSPSRRTSPGSRRPSAAGGRERVVDRTPPAGLRRLRAR